MAVPVTIERTVTAPGRIEPTMVTPICATVAAAAARVPIMVAPIPVAAVAVPVPTVPAVAATCRVIAE